MSSEYKFGIDLGTTNSAIAKSNGVEIRSYQNNDQKSVTPSAVRVQKNGRLLVGQRAYNAVVEDPENVATEFKRTMGQKVSKTFPSCGRSMTPEELSAEVLKSLKDDVRRQTGEEVKQSVITVPAAFGTLQCEATSRAASLAGITETYLLQEPIAAAIAYGVGPNTIDKRWLVFDLGGGTLDIAVVSTRDGRLAVLEHRGNNLLGGKDMERIIVDQLFIPALEREFKLPEAGSRERVSLLRRLAVHAELAKIDLSSCERVEVSLLNLGTDRQGTPIEAEIAITRSEFERRIDALVRTCVEAAQEALSAARLSGNDLDRVLLVGGPTQIPYVRAALAETLGADIDCSIDPMTVVSRGAALFASSVEWPEEIESSTSSSDGKLILKLGYDKVSASIQAQVRGKLQPANGVDAIKLDADGGFWTSGWIPVSGGVLDTRVQLIEGKATRFWIYGRRSDGSLVDVDPDSLSIRHGLVPAAPPLPHSIGIELIKTDGKSEVDFIFRKGRPLPAEESISYRAVREIRPSRPDDFLAIKVWEGETPEDPDANMWVGAMRIIGRSIRHSIPEGAEIQLHVRIDESRRISVDASIPHSGDSLSEGIYIPDREQQDPMEQMNGLPNSTDQLVDRLLAVEDAMVHCEDPQTFEEVDRLRKDLEEVDILASRRTALKDDPDLASRLLERVRGIRQGLVAVEGRIGTNRPADPEIEQGRQEANSTKEVTEKFGSDTEKRELATLAQALERAASRGDARSARKVREHLRSLRWRVLSNQNWYWTESLEAQQAAGRKFINKQEAEKWLNAGAEALRKGDSVTLQEAVRHLWSLQPKSEVDLDKERAMQAGLRRF